jgi:hypothetical protein
VKPSDKNILRPEVQKAHEKYWSDLREFRALHSDPECLAEGLAHVDRMKAVSDTVLIQYVTCASILQEIFKLAPDRCWLEDGVGCCAWEGSVDDDQGASLASWRFIRHHLRDLAFPERKTDNRACSYHKDGSGCVLGELKSPKCLYTICEHGDDLPRSYRELDDKETLQTVLSGGLAWESDGRYNFNPEKNWPLVHEFVRKGRLVIDEMLTRRLVQLSFVSTSSLPAVSGLE